MYFRGGEVSEKMYNTVVVWGVKKKKVNKHLNVNKLWSMIPHALRYLKNNGIKQEQKPKC